jgi:hypothetical protein
MTTTVTGPTSATTARSTSTRRVDELRDGAVAVEGECTDATPGKLLRRGAN